MALSSSPPAVVAADRRDLCGRSHDPRATSDLDLCVSPSLSSLHHRQCEPCSCHISMGCEHMQARAGVGRGRRNVRRGGCVRKHAKSGRSATPKEGRADGDVALAPGDSELGLHLGKAKCKSPHARGATQHRRAIGATNPKPHALPACAYLTRQTQQARTRDGVNVSLATFFLTIPLPKRIKNVVITTKIPVKQPH